MLLGLLIACIGMENSAGTPRFTFGGDNLLGGIEPIRRWSASSRCPR